MRTIFDKVHEIVLESEVQNRNGRPTLKYDRVENVDIAAPVVDNFEFEDWMVEVGDGDRRRDSLDSELGLE